MSPELCPQRDPPAAHETRAFKETPTQAEPHPSPGLEEWIGGFCPNHLREAPPMLLRASPSLFSERSRTACDAGDAGLIAGLGRSLEKQIATHSSIPTWKIPWMEEPGGLQSLGPQMSWIQMLNNDTPCHPPPGPAPHQDAQHTKTGKAPPTFYLNLFWLLLGYGNEGVPHSLGGAGVPLCRWSLAQALPLSEPLWSLGRGFVCGWGSPQTHRLR